MRPSLTPPAIIQPAATLFDWARTEAAAIESMRARLDEKREALATITAVVEESMEYGEVEELKDRLKAARTAALDCDAVERASDLLKKARKALKKITSSSKASVLAGEVRALKGVVEEGKSRLASGRVPTTVEES